MNFGDPLVIRDASQLHAIWGNPAIIRRRPLIIDLPRLTAEQSRTAAERIAAQAAECGCSMGAKFMAGATVCAASWLLHVYGLTAQLLWRLPWALPVVIAAAGAGKAIGIVRARTQFRNELTSLIERVEV
jgi:hypothetical protein